MLASTKRTKPVLQRSAEILGGTLVFSGTRVPFQTFIDYLKAGHTLDEFLDDFPTVGREQVLSALEMAQDALVKENNASPAG
jgi:uncharacterized protein (DUF433 family)